MIREERADDIDAVRAVNLAAFGRAAEGALVDALRANGGVLLSLVATFAERAAGHILYSPVSIIHDGKQTEGAGLGPMAVIPELQRKGIGSRLIRAGNEQLRARGFPFIVVLGHPEYYPRFGFRPANATGVRCPWNAPDNAFMILSLDAAKMKEVAGTGKYRDEFSRVV
jgi:putative acetyltransferase